MNENKYCPTCKKDKPIDQFNKNKTQKDGHATQCRSCRSTYVVNKYATNSEYRASIKFDYIKRTHKLTPEEYKNMYNAQNGKCNICNEKFKRKRCIYVDHDHNTGIVRSLLCPKCNILLGACNDNISILETAISYLKKHNKKTPALPVLGGKINQNANELFLHMYVISFFYLLQTTLDNNCQVHYLLLRTLDNPL